MDHVPELSLSADFPFFSAEQAGAVLDGGKRFRKDLVEVAFPEFVELGRDVVPGGLAFFNGGRSGFHRGEGGEFVFQGFKAGIQPGGDAFQLFFGRGFHDAHGRQVHGEEAMQVALPFLCFFKQEVLSLAVP